MKTRHVLSFAASLAICAVLVYVAAHFVAKEDEPIIETSETEYDTNEMDDQGNSTMNNIHLENIDEFNMNNTFTSEEIEEETTTQHYYVKIFQSILENDKNKAEVTTEKALTNNYEYENRDDNENESITSKVEHAVSSTYSTNKVVSYATEKYANSGDDELNYNSTESYEDKFEFGENTSTITPENINEKKIHPDVDTLIYNGTEAREGVVGSRETSTVASDAVAGDYDYYEEYEDIYGD